MLGRRPGFVGVFSGVAPGRFAVTLNAVLSAEPPQPATPVVLLLRTVLEHAQTFNYLATACYADRGSSGRNGGYRAHAFALRGLRAELLGTWRQRLQRVASLMDGQLPRNSEDCFRYLSDPEAQVNMVR